MGAVAFGISITTGNLFQQFVDVRSCFSLISFIRPQSEHKPPFEGNNLVWLALGHEAKMLKLYTGSKNSNLPKQKITWKRYEKNKQIFELLCFVCILSLKSNFDNQLKITQNGTYDIWDKFGFYISGSRIRIRAVVFTGNCHQNVKEILTLVPVECRLTVCYILAVLQMRIWIRL